jgi:hypothetical protein
LNSYQVFSKLHPILLEGKDKEIDFTDQNIYTGFDANLKSWKVIFIAEVQYEFRRISTERTY